MLIPYLATTVLSFCIVAMDVGGVFCAARILRFKTNWRWPAALDDVGTPLTDYLEQRTTTLVYRLGGTLTPGWHTWAAFGLIFLGRIVVVGLYQLLV